MSRTATASSYSITMRLHTPPDQGIVGAVATAIADAGGVVTGIDVVESSPTRLRLDVTCSASDGDHALLLQQAVAALGGVEVHKVSDRTFLLHLGGKIEVTSKVPLKTRDDLSMAYTPGVGRVSMAIFEHPEDVSHLTIKGNAVIRTTKIGVIGESPNQMRAKIAQIADDTVLSTGRIGSKKVPSARCEPSRMPPGTPIATASAKPASTRPSVVRRLIGRSPVCDSCTMRANTRSGRGST